MSRASACEMPRSLRYASNFFCEFSKLALRMLASSVSICLGVTAHGVPHFLASSCTIFDRTSWSSTDCSTAV